jgi:hypothetical protein
MNIPKKRKNQINKRNKPIVRGIPGQMTVHPSRQWNYQSQRYLSDPPVYLTEAILFLIGKDLR